MVYTITATVVIAADSASEACDYLKHAIASSRHTDIILVDTTVTSAVEEDQ